MRNRILMGALLVAALLIAVPAFAGNGKGGSGGGKGNGSSGSTSSGVSITLNQAAPALGSWVSFTTSVPSNVQNPRVEVLCYQNGAEVYGEAGSTADSFMLGGSGSVWKTNGGAASCVANLFYFSSSGGTSTAVYLASTQFSAAG